jgi:hypothetical protein
MKAAIKPFVILVVLATIGLGAAVIIGHEIGAAAVAKHHAAAGTAAEGTAAKH